MRILKFVAGLLFVLTAGADGSAEISQQDIDQLAAAIDIRYHIIDNNGPCPKTVFKGPCFHGAMTLSAELDKPSRHWQLYFSHIAPIRAVDSSEFSIEHINGDLHRLTPSNAFAGFSPGSSYSLTFKADLWHLSEHDVIPNYYIVAEGLEPRILRSTVSREDPETGLSVAAFVTPWTNVDKHFKRQPDDLTEWASAKNLYYRNQSTTLLDSGLSNAIIPSPSQLLPGKGPAADLSKGVRLHLQRIEKTALTAALARLVSLGIAEKPSGIDTTITLRPQPGAMPGSYQLTIQSDHIAIVAVDEEAAANALNSIVSLLMPEQLSLPPMHINDQPRYAFRGLHIDVARNFHSKTLILKLLDQMAAIKLNKLHLHLADDEGWRLQIEGLPELTDIASRRCHDLSETRCLLPQLGSGPNENATVNGYYSADDYIEILQAAKARHIQLIPSLDMPGHSRAAVVAMRARHDNLMREGKTALAKQYLLSDILDRSEYRSVQFYNDNTINPCMESSFAFVEKVIDEVAKLHDKAGSPLTRYHIGADETAGAWTQSPQCEVFFTHNKHMIEGPEQLGGYFVERVATLLAKRSIETAGWNDGLATTDVEQMPAQVQSNAWTPLFWDGHKTAHEQANRGWQVVVSTPDVTYFDFPYQPDPKEPGFYWASRGTDSRKVFEFMPDNLPAHAELWRDRNGQSYVADDQPQRDEQGGILHQPLAAGRTFIGLQGHLWSETVRSDRQVEYMLFPRLLALAERAWHRAPWELAYDYQGLRYSTDSHYFSDQQRALRDQQWNRFANILGQKVLPKLDRDNIRYRLPTVGAIIKDNTLHANTAFPGLAIEYRDATGLWQSYTNPVEVNGSTEVRSVSADGQRKSRTLMVAQ